MLLARYTTLSPTKLDCIVSQYPIGTPLKFEEIPGGFVNSNFKLTTADGEFLLKICDKKDQVAKLAGDLWDQVVAVGHETLGVAELLGCHDPGASPFSSACPGGY